MINLEKKKFLISGAHGQLGREFNRLLSRQNIHYYSPDESEFDITNKEKILKVISEYHPDYLINCAAYNLVDQAEEDSALAFAINADSLGFLADICRENDIFLIHYSSDYVFDGKKNAPYAEEDIPHPINIYGKSKLKGEENLQTNLNNYLIFRLSWVIGAGKQNFLYKLSQWAKKNYELKISDDEISVPTFTRDIAEITLLSLRHELKGLYHLVSSGYASRYELAKYYAQKVNLKTMVHPVSSNIFKTKAPRPKFSAMTNKKLSEKLKISILSWRESLNQYLEKNKEK